MPDPSREAHGVEDEDHVLGDGSQGCGEPVEDQGEGDGLEPDLGEHGHPSVHLFEGDDEREPKAHDGDEDGDYESHEGAAQS